MDIRSVHLFYSGDRRPINPFLVKLRVALYRIEICFKDDVSDVCVICKFICNNDLSPAVGEKRDIFGLYRITAIVKAFNVPETV